MLWMDILDVRIMKYFFNNHNHVIYDILYYFIIQQPNFRQIS
jgi:hypothetical protein